jgi:hypothetical protein
MAIVALYLREIGGSEEVMRATTKRRTSLLICCRMQRPGATSTSPSGNAGRKTGAHSADLDPARRSIARSAMAEAAVQLQNGLDQLALLPDTPERQRQELEFLSFLGAVLRAVKGLASPETGRAFARARELWEQLGSPSEFLQVPYGSHSTTRTAANLIWRSAWTRICCV